MNEPIAIVGIACLYPGAHGVDAFWELLNSPDALCGAGDPGEVDVDLAQFRIPPVQRGAMTRMQILMLEVARQCLIDAGHPERALPMERTDVVVGTCFGLDRQYANALRVAGAGYGRDVERAAARDSDERTRAASARLRRQLRARLIDRLGAAAHDRVGEMASTIPARIATAFHLLGRTIAVESTDATAFVAVDHAVRGLRLGTADAVLVVTGQRNERGFALDALAAKGLAPNSAPSEGVSALLLKRRETALRDGDRVYASILEGVLRHEPRPGVFRYSTTAEERYRIAKECHDAAGVTPTAIRYVESVGPGIPAVTNAETRALTRLFGDNTPESVALHSIHENIGHTFANAGLAGITATALALHHGTLPPRPGPLADPSGTPFRSVRAPEQWPTEPGRLSDTTQFEARYAAVCGSALGGAFGYFLLGAVGALGRPRQQHSPGRSSADEEAIAIVGFGGTFAGGADAAALWQTIKAGRTGLGPLPETVLDRELYFAPGEVTLTHSYCQVGGVVSVPQRPPEGVRITPHRYRVMDPAQRLALLVAEETLTRYGRRAQLRGRIGVIAIGSTLSLSSERGRNAERSVTELEAALATTDAWAELPQAAQTRVLDQVRRMNPGASEPLSPVDLDGCLASGVAALVANEYQLSAVPVAVEAACASTLAAIDLAVGSLRMGNVDFAVVGGVELACTPRDLVLCSALGLLSHSSITPFDIAADGFSPGDGCAMFLLERLSDARRNSDEIFGLIRGVGGSNDAKSAIAPDADGQARAMRRAFEQIDVDPATVDYLEAHGTGTRVGDRVEIDAATRVYGASERTRPLTIGSVKAVVGHTFAAAGGAGLLEALQAMRAKTFPPNASLRTLNPDLPLGDIPAVLPAAATPWPATAGRPRRAAVSSFGTGGINYHLLLEEYRPEGGAR